MNVLVVPCYNEEKRLESDKFLNFKNAKILFVNDGSTDQTRALLDRLAAQSKHLTVLHLNQNVGKAEAVRLGMMKAFVDRGSDTEWIGFWDADLATPLEEAAFFVDYLKLSEKNSNSVSGIFGSRLKRFGSKIVRNPKRHYLSRVFTTVVSIVLDIKCYDSQCGAKLFKADVVPQLFDSQFMTKWIFDLEIILRGRHLKFIECPVRQWIDVPGSKVKVLRESIRVLVDIFKLRNRYLKNQA